MYVLVGEHVILLSSAAEIDFVSTAGMPVEKMNEFRLSWVCARAPSPLTSPPERPATLLHALRGQAAA